ncbi:MAG: ABC transporter permease [Candidatus Bathyarchaeia archaeon]
MKSKAKFIPQFTPTLIVYVLAMAVSFIGTGIVIYLLKMDVLTAYSFFLYEALGTTYGIAETLTKATPILLCALGLAPAFASGFFNIGSEGQLFFGATISFWIWWTFNYLPPILLYPLLIAGGFLAGGFWALIPGILKVKLRISEVITTILMNFIAILLVTYLVGYEGPWKDPEAQQLWSYTISSEFWLKKIIPGTRLHAGFIIATLCVPIIYLLMKKAIMGYKIKAIGLNPFAAKYGGINVSRNIIMVSLISGGLAGLAGFNEAFGIQYRLMSGLSPGFGYFAIQVAILGKNSPLGVLLWSIIYGALLNGGEAMQRGAGVPIAVSYTLMGLVMVTAIIFDIIIRRRLE